MLIVYLDAYLFFLHASPSGYQKQMKHFKNFLKPLKKDTNLTLQEMRFHYSAIRVDSEDKLYSFFSTTQTKV